MSNIYKHQRSTYFLVGKLFAATLFTDLMTFIVATRCTVATIVLLLTTDTFAATLSLFLCLQMRKYK